MNSRKGIEEKLFLLTGGSLLTLHYPSIYDILKKNSIFVSNTAKFHSLCDH